MSVLTVHLDRQDLVDDLVASFHKSGCSARRTGPDSCAVDHHAAADEREAQIEVRFFLRAWQARHHFVRALVAD